MARRVLDVIILCEIFIATKCSANVNILKAISRKTSQPFSDIVNNSKGFIELAAENGYQAEAHDVLTEDGYILTMHRIPAAKNCPKRYPVLILHGLLQASESWLDAGPQAPGYIISGECYDVWFGNMRGNYNGRKHVTLNPDTDLAFWKFSYDEMGLYDLPAMIDYVLGNTSSEKLIYIGYSQSGGSFIVMTSEKPEYADKVSLFVALSPGTRGLYTKSVGFKVLAKVTNLFRTDLEAAGVWEVLSKGFPIQGALSFLCQVKLLAGIVCGLATFIIDSSHPGSLNPDIQKRLYEHFPAGTSVQNLAHFGQDQTSKIFEKFDFGEQENLKKYGRAKPPVYDISAVKTPSLIFHGLSDHVVDGKDVEWAIRQFSNVLEYIQLEEDPLWNHLDMIYSRYWNETVFVRMKEYLIKYSNNVE